MRHLYEYKCDVCDYIVTSREKVEDRDRYTGKDCQCGEGKYRRSIANPLVKFSGQGWTDERRN